MINKIYNHLFISANLIEKIKYLDIEIYYNYKGDNEIILDTTLLIYQDKDLVDFESLDIFNLTEKKLCYNESNINYEISIESLIAFAWQARKIFSF